MWRLADRQLDEFLADGECEFIERVRQPVHAAGDRRPARRARGGPRRRSARRSHGGHGRGRTVGSTGERAMAHTPLEYLYERFTDYVEDRRREPRDDVLTGLATATFPDGSTARGHRRRARRRQPVRGRPGDDGPAARHRAEADRRATRAPGSSCAPTATASRTSSRRRCASRARSRATSGCRACRRRSAASTCRPAPR